MVPRTATIAIAALTAAAWVIALLLGLLAPAALSLGFIPARLSGAEVPWPALPTLVTPFSATLVHAAQPLHIIFNLLILVWCGSQVERVLGRWSLVLIYVAGAYAAALLQWASDPMGVEPMIGASGAVSAVMGAFALSFGRPQMVTRSARLNRWINVVWLLAAWVVLQLMLGWLAGVQGYLLATAAHIGGFAAGLLLQRPLLLWRYRSA